ncbi:MAG: hypothetical protein ACI814_000919 [Mariniblastus sp.]|jgi:hypothetical protein
MVTQSIKTRAGYPGCLICSVGFLKTVSSFTPNMNPRTAKQNMATSFGLSHARNSSSSQICSGKLFRLYAWLHDFVVRAASFEPQNLDLSSDSGHVPSMERRAELGKTDKRIQAESSLSRWACTFHRQSASRRVSQERFFNINDHVSGVPLCGRAC